MRELVVAGGMVIGLVALVFVAIATGVVGLWACRWLWKWLAGIVDEAVGG